MSLITLAVSAETPFAGWCQRVLSLLMVAMTRKRLGCFQTAGMYMWLCIAASAGFSKSWISKREIKRFFLQSSWKAKGFIQPHSPFMAPSHWHPQDSGRLSCGVSHSQLSSCDPVSRRSYQVMLACLGLEDQCLIPFLFLRCRIVYHQLGFLFICVTQCVPDLHGDNIIGRNFIHNYGASCLAVACSVCSEIWSSRAIS